MTEIGAGMAGADLPGTAIFDRVVIVGVGLMGGSLGLGLIQHNAAQQVVGIDSAQVLDAALAAGAIHGAGASLEEAAATADLLVLASPIHTIPSLLCQLAPHIGPHATVTDLGSVKSAIVAEGVRLLGDRFVGGHPMAGSEQTGIRSAPEQPVSPRMRMGVNADTNWTGQRAPRGEAVENGACSRCKAADSWAE